VKEDVGVDVKENYVQYHIKDEGKEIWVIHDFNRVSNTRIGLYELVVTFLSFVAVTACSGESKGQTANSLTSSCYKIRLIAHHF